MNIRYVTDSRLSEALASSQHILGMCYAAVQQGHGLELVYLAPSVGFGGRDSATQREITIPSPSFRGGPRIARRIFSTWISTHASSAERRPLATHLLTKLPGWSSSFSPDVWYFRVTPAKPTVSAIAALTGPKVLEVNGAEMLESAAGIALCRDMDLLLAGSESMRRTIVDAAGIDASRVQVHLNAAMDLASMQPADKCETRMSMGFGEDDFIVLYVSHFRPYHDTETIEAAILGLLGDDRSGRMTFVVLGAGEGYERWKSVFAQHLVGGRVMMPGLVDPERLKSYIGAADVCLNTISASKLRAEENFQAQKLYDYIACERPVIESVDFSMPIPDWARNGLSLVSPEDSAALRRAILDTRDRLDYWNARVKDAKAVLARSRTWDTAASLTIDHIRDMLARYHGGRLLPGEHP